ncbi:FAD/NAD(P)-binding domain-containing protein [Lentinula aff. lateritia]|uniref:FAD/NAD(P)-binding domain-containing protein n=1 Tax=Lentinula aff. lateritia TaxID=2804960 RepID=A0ACC1TY68_9AGAR|nr:FAD/NAD(P)-binding domain-containing protein [Lentinula aff. lateritia]
MASSPTKVIIVGCGVAGPVLACILKSKGFRPVVYERIKRDSDGGLSLMLQSNGLRVLALIPGLLEQLPGQVENHMAFYSTVPGHEELLGDYTLKTPLDTVGTMNNSVNSVGMGIRRHDFLRVLSETVTRAGVEIHYEHKVVDVQQDADIVHVKFENGTIDTASFVVGCDGIHSNTRISLFGKEEASYTGLTQLGGFSPSPKSWTRKNAMVNYFGEETHMISYQIGPDLNSWAITRREAEHKETWRAVDDSILEELKKEPVSKWGFGAGELVQTAEKMIKYGLYDRPELKTWHKGRVILIGDAAHPTSPHLGQGANQALEDVYHLVRVLLKYNPSVREPSTGALKNAFEEFESIRLPRTSSLVKQARQTGEKTRVIKGTAACLSRNEAIRTIWANPEASVQSLANARSGPFDGESEI